MKHPLTLRAIRVPRRDAERAFDTALDLLAEGLATVVIDESRAEVAARMGVAPESIDREQHDLDAVLRRVADPLAGGNR